MDFWVVEQMLSECLFSFIHSFVMNQPSTLYASFACLNQDPETLQFHSPASKITDMLLEMDSIDFINIVQDQSSLQGKVWEAIYLLEDFHQQFLHASY